MQTVVTEDVMVVRTREDVALLLKNSGLPPEEAQEIYNVLTDFIVFG